MAIQRWKDGKETENIYVDLSHCQKQIMTLIEDKCSFWGSKVPVFSVYSNIPVGLLPNILGKLSFCDPTYSALHVEVTAEQSSCLRCVVTSTTLTDMQILLRQNKKNILFLMRIENICTRMWQLFKENHQLIFKAFISCSVKHVMDSCTNLPGQNIPQVPLVIQSTDLRNSRLKPDANILALRWPLCQFNQSQMLSTALSSSPEHRFLILYCMGTWQANDALSVGGERC